MTNDFWPRYYSGMCIGGPMDGLWRKSDRMDFVVHGEILPAMLNPNDYASIPDMGVVCRSYHYRYRENVLHLGRRDIGFWVLTEVPMTPEAIVEHIIDRYSKLAQADIKRREEDAVERRFLSHATEKFTNTPLRHLYPKTTPEEEDSEAIWAS